MGTDRELDAEARIRKAGLSPILIGIVIDPRGVMSARYLIGISIQTIVGAGDTDQQMTDDIIRQARRLGLDELR